MREYAIETDIVHGVHAEHITTGDLVPPLHMTATYRFKTARHGADLFEGNEAGFIYSRIGNPTVDLLQRKIALLEGAGDAIATASGMAAVAAVAMTLAKPGENFVSSTTVYGGSFALFQTHLRRLGIDARFISPEKAASPDAVAALIDPKTRFLYIETPANPTVDIIDIRNWSDIAASHGIPLIVDNTFASPYLQRPLSLGASAVVHSATKYLGGHGDLVAGLVAGPREMMNRIREHYTHHFGPCMSPFNAWLILRGVKTLAIRMDRHCKNAMTVAEWLERHPKVENVRYPGLVSHPGHTVAAGQMKGFGGMIAFEIKGGIDAGRHVMDGVRLCVLAVSLGDCETLIQHPASMTHSIYTSEERESAGITDGLIRLSVGLEEPADIITDLEAAMVGF